MEHIEQAGIHSGDSACSLPSISLSPAVLQQIRTWTVQLAQALSVVGLMNIQFAVVGAQGYSPQVYILEANPRASRTVPFVSKSTGIPLAKVASLIMSGKTLEELNFTEEVIPAHIAVKEAVLPFNKFPGTDTILGPEMRSTGEVMGIDSTFPKAFAKSQDAAYGGLPRSGTVFVSVADRDKRSVILPMLRLSQLGFTLIATEGTAETLARYGIHAEVVRKHTEVSGSGTGPSVVDLIQANKIDVVVNTPRGRSARADGYEIRTATVAADKALFTTIAQLGAAVASLEQRPETPEVTSLQDYQRRRDAAS